MAHHHHHHSSDWGEARAASIRRILILTVAALGFATLVGLVIWWPRSEPEVDTTVLGLNDRVEATVTDAETGPCSYEPTSDCARITARLTSGPNEGTDAAIETSLDGESAIAALNEGDGILLYDAGAEVPADSRFSFADVERKTPLLVLVAVFAAAVVALGRRRGLLALAGIVLSIGVLLYFIFPALLSGTTPIGVALTGASIIAFGTIYLAHGVNDRTTIALLGTLASLALTAVLGMTFASAAHLSGLASEDSLTLLAFAPDIDYRGLLLAAVIIGTLGVLDDVTITQVSAVWELHRSNPQAGPRQLYAAGIRIGRDHIASTVNTLVLAYSAAALPLLLLYTQSGLGFGDAVTSEIVAVEIVQTLVGSLGLVAAVPLTTALASWVVTTSARQTETEITERDDDMFWRGRLSI